MTIQKIKPQTLLSTLWIFVLMNMVFRDLHQFGNKGFLEEMMSGEVNGVVITEQLMLVGGILAEVPILMVLLSRILNNKVNKWTNIIAGTITMGVFATSIPAADMDDIFYMIIEVVAILWIFKISWTLPKPSEINSINN